MEKLLITFVSEPLAYQGFPYFRVVDGEGKKYTSSKMEERTKYLVGQLNDVVTTRKEDGKYKIELATTASIVATVPGKGKNIPKPDAPSIEVDTKLRSMVCAYAKDLACYGKIEVNDIEGWADYFLGYISGTKIVSLRQYPLQAPEAPQSKSSGIDEPDNSKALVEEAVELGGEVVPSAEDIKAKVSKLIEANKALKVGTFVAMMEKLQAGVTAKSEKNKFGNATLVGVYQALTDDNKIKFNKQIG